MQNAAQKTLDSANAEQVILERMPLVRLIARDLARKVPPSILYDDLVSAGTVGLIEAVRSYDAAKGANLDTYLHYRIRGAILDYLRDEDHLSRMYRRRARLMEDTRQRMRKAGVDTSDEEVAKRIGISVETYHQWQCRAAALSSLDSATLPQDHLRFLADPRCVRPDEQMEERERSRLLQRALRRVPPTERKVLLALCEGAGTQVIARSLGVTASRISQVKRSGLERLRGILACSHNGSGCLRPAA
jgi:RNA polymerase sigma factor for flagellar operon FliA